MVKRLSITWASAPRRPALKRSTRPCRVSPEETRMWEITKIEGRGTEFTEDPVPKAECSHAGAPNPFGRLCVHTTQPPVRPPVWLLTTHWTGDSSPSPLLSDPQLPRPSSHKCPRCWWALRMRAPSGSGWLLAYAGATGSGVSGEAPGLGPDGLSEFLEELLAYFRGGTSGGAELG